MSGRKCHVIVYALYSQQNRGALIFVGMCFCSRISAVMCALGSAIGLFFAFGLGADRSDIYFGLWGFNPALSAICIGGMFFKFSSLSFLYAGLYIVSLNLQPN